MATISVGTSGWHYAHWRGRFYPADLPAAKWLPYYAARFSCVEINNTFYRRPEPRTVAEWRDRSTPGFRFALKAWRVITHRRKLANCADAVDSFFSRIAALGEKTGPILFQLPPRWQRNAQRLDGFLGLLPAGLRYAFEFRDPAWHHPDIHAILASHNAAFCIYDIAGWNPQPVRTADFVYIRLHGAAGPYAGDYPAPALRRWAERVRDWHREGRDVYVFFNNDHNAYAVKNAEYLKSLLAFGQS